MIRMALRQFRAEAIVGIIVLIGLGGLLLITGIHLADVSNAFLSTCKAAKDCTSDNNPVLNAEKPLQGAVPLIVDVAPALVGLFLGAPLIARELESGTLRLAWTQSVTRQRWLLVKLSLVGLVAMALGGLVTWMADWWASPLDAINQNQFGAANFGLHGVAPLGYAAFAFALGVTVGVLLRRTVPAMAVTLIGFIGARLVVTYWVRPNLFSPMHETLSLLSASAPPGFGVQQPEGTVSLVAPYVGVPNGWVYSTSIIGKSGAAPTSQYLLHACPTVGQIVQSAPGEPGGGSAIGVQKHAVAAPGRVSAAFQNCLDKLSTTFHTLVTYQPASRFWPLQWAELGIFLAAAIGLCGVTFWWLKRQYG